MEVEAAGGRQSARLVTSFAWCAAIALGIRHAWHGRHEIIGDAVSYLDVGEAFAHGDWASAINGYWSPLYPWALGLALRITRVERQDEFVVIAAVNVLVYLIALIAFSRLLKELGRERRVLAGGESGTPLSNGIWLALCYLAFIWSSMHVLSVSDITPDMAFAAVVYYCTAVLLRVRRGDVRWRTFILLGAGLGVGYLIKVPMLVIAPVFLACAALATRNVSRAIPRLALTTLVFAVITAPFVAALSLHKGRLTAGDSPRLNLAWNMNKVPRGFWLGGPPEVGFPAHPPRLIHASPPVFEFARPVAATYPPWHDPTYWYEGVTPRWNFDGLHESLVEGRILYQRLVRSQFPFLLAIAGLLLLNPRRSLSQALALWPIWIVAAAGLALFAVVHVETRYIGQYFALAMVSGLTAVEVRDRFVRTRLILTAVLLVSLARPVVARAFRPYEATGVARINIAVGQALRQLGVSPGDRAALLRIGAGGIYWARVAGVQVVAEIPSADAFWRADPPARRAAVAAIADTGALVLVTSELPNNADPAGWVRLGRTNWHAYRLGR